MFHYVCGINLISAIDLSATSCDHLRLFDIECRNMLNDEHSTPGGAIISIVDAREEKAIELEIEMGGIKKDLQYEY